MEGTPQQLLTRHFFRSLFDFGFLSDAGAESFKRLLLGISAVAMALGLLLVRILVGKYIGLSKYGTAADYQREVTADHAFLIAVPMWVVAFAIVLVGHALFPDETDYRILMAQPISRATVFRAKLVALLRFAGLFVVGTHAALAPMYFITAINRLAPHNVIVHTLAFEAASFAGSLFAALAIVALHGLLVLVAPRARLVAFSTLVRSGLVCALVLALPLLMRLPGTGRRIAGDVWWLPWAPPIWFVGLERWLLGLTGPAVPLAPIAIAGTAFVLAIAAASYVTLYRRFDRVILRPQAPHAPPRRARAITLPIARPVRQAIRRFAAITFRRSVLHQGIVVALVAVAAGFVMNGVLGLDAAGGRGRDRSRAREAATEVLVCWAPYVLMFIAAPAIRLALSVPIDLRANWIFRMTEDDRTRADAIAAAVLTTFWLGVVAPVALVAPFQWMVLGLSTLAIVTVNLLVGWLFVEVLMQDWRRVPFTCSYLPGKGFIPQMVLKAVTGFFLFTGLGTLLGGLTLVIPAAAVFMSVLVGVPALAMMIRRRRTAGEVPLIFEDQLPTELNVLRLTD